MTVQDTTIKTLIVDDDPFVRMSLQTILEAQHGVEVCGLGDSGEQAVQLYDEVHPDVLLVDIQMPGIGGLEAAERILQAHPDARVVFLTTFSDDEYIMRALRIGAKGYLIKQEVSTIAPALRAVMAGQNVLGTEVLERMDALVHASDGAVAEDVGANAFAPVVSQGAAGSPPEDKTSDSVSVGSSIVADALTERERAVVELVAEGLDNKEIAARLFLSEGTVRNHMSTILQKMECKNRTQLVVAYYRSRS